VSIGEAERQCGTDVVELGSSRSSRRLVRAAQVPVGGLDQIQVVIAVDGAVSSSSEPAPARRSAA